MHMRRFTLVSSVAVIAILATLGFIGIAGADRIDAADQGGRPFETTLLGANEVPVLGDPDGSGTALITLNHGQSTVCWDLTVSGIAPATLAHIHVGEVGVAGGVVVTLTPPTDGSSDGCTTAGRALIKAIMQNPDGYYVNVHNADFPDGALRGQLGK